MSRIRCLSLHQPWASLIAGGAKRIETRSWFTSYRGPLAIHAAKTTASVRMALVPTFYHALSNAGGFGVGGEGLPLGGIIAVADLAFCYPVEQVDWHVFNVEKEFGNYEVERYAWELHNVRRVDPMIPLVGRQGLWTIDDSIIPEGILSKSENK